jgi:hypothetical protein
VLAVAAIEGAADASLGCSVCGAAAVEDVVGGRAALEDAACALGVEGFCVDSARICLRLFLASGLSCSGAEGGIEVVVAGAANGAVSS